MIHETRILEAIQQSGVSRIAIIDDVFDAPEINEDNAGNLLDYLESSSFAELVSELSLGQESHSLAIQALNESNFDSEDLRDCIVALYDRFIATAEERFDPGRIFSRAKGDNLKNLRPLLELLKKCRPRLEITRIGSRPQDLTSVEAEPHVIFIDFYLNPEVAAADTPSIKQKKEAKAAAVDRVTKLIDDQADRASSVVLMSSHSVGAEAEKFRDKLNKDHSRVFASRFTFIEKTHLAITDDGIDLEQEAADALLDIFQSYEFGRALYAGVNCWLESAERAVKDLRTDIGALELKDFAYLVRFRLAQEGQSLLEYLDWLFGECLLDSVERAVDDAADNNSNNRLPALDESMASRIEGAYDGPTRKIAELYHKARIESPRKVRPKHCRLGDLYLVNGKKRIIAVMTPDCDLVERKKGKRRAPRLLTVGGKLKAFDAPDTSVSDFVLIDKKPYNITWDPKDIETREFKEWPAPGDTSEELTHIGALRPLYAQQLQRVLLHDLGRVGVSVAPAIGMTASVQVYIMSKSGERIELIEEVIKGAACTVVPARGGLDKAKAIFTRKFVVNLISILSERNPPDLIPCAADNLAQLKQPDAYQRLEKMLRSAIIEEPVDLGIFLTSSARSVESRDGQTWCWLIVSMGNQE